MNLDSTERFELGLEVRSDDIDALGHVNNVVFVRWVQEAAAAHWSARTTAAERAATAWVVVRHEIDYRRPALPGDRLVARTWVGAAQGRAFERHTEILRPGEERPLARARTLWLPVDPASGRPTMVSDDLRARFSVAESGPA